MSTTAWTDHLDHGDGTRHTSVVILTPPEPVFDGICYVDVKLDDGFHSVTVALHVDVIPELLSKLAVEYGKGMAHRAERDFVHAA